MNTDDQPREGRATSAVVPSDNPVPMPGVPVANVPAHQTRQGDAGEKRKKNEPLVAPAPSRAQTLKTMPVPPEWVGVRGASTAGAVAVVAGMILGSNQALTGHALAGAAIIGGGVLLGAWGWALSRFANWAIAGFLAVGAALVLLANLTGHPGLAWTAGLVTAALASLAGWELFRRAAVARALVLLSAGLQAAVGLGKQPNPWQTVTPRWYKANRHTGLPTRWALPVGLPSDPRSILLLEHEATRFAGVPVKLTIGKRGKYGYLTARAAGDPLPPLHTVPMPVDAEVARVATTLSAIVGEARIIELAYNAETDEFERLEFSWPDEKNSVMSRRGVQNSVIRTVKATVKATRDGGSLEKHHLAVAPDLPNNRMIITPVKPMPTKIPHPPRDAEAGSLVRFGVRRSGLECVWDLESTAAHVAIGGLTGGGKTTIFLSILVDLPPDAEVFSIDPKYTSLKGIELLPQSHGREAASEPEEMVDAIEDFFEEMMRRVKGVRKGTIKRRDLAHWVLVVDEGETLVDFLNDHWKDPDAKEAYATRRGWAKAPQSSSHPVIGRISRIVQLAREAKMHLLLASQQFGATWLGTNARDQFAVRIGMGNMSQIASKMLFDDAYAASSGLEAGPGRAWVQLGVGQEVEQAQIFYTPKLDVDDLSDVDRELLSSLGVEMPEGEPDANPSVLHNAAEAATAEADAAAARHLHAVPAPELVAAPVAEAVDADALPESIDSPAADLMPDDRIIVDTDDGPALAVVESIDPDDAEPENLVVTYRIEGTDEVDSLSLPDYESLPLVAA